MTWECSDGQSRGHDYPRRHVRRVVRVGSTALCVVVGFTMAASLTLLPLVIGYQAWTYWVFRRRITAEAIPASVGLARRSS